MKARLLSLALLLPFTGCASMSWSPGWQEPIVAPAKGDVEALFAQAEALVNGADTRGEVEELIDAYLAVVAADPSHRPALHAAATYSILLGTGYCADDDEKERNFRRAIQLSELAMYQNPDFKALVDAGTPVWDAAHTLGPEDAGAMGWWSNGVFYYYKECMSYPAKLSNYPWVERAAALMRRLEEVDPDWEGGGNHFSWAIYYIALPESAGGDLEQARQYLEKAAKADPRRLVTPWGRAKYYCPRVGDRAGFERDLRWVLEQDPHGPGNPYPWNVYFQAQARALLAEVDDIF